jgi:hypothetical protein
MQETRMSGLLIGLSLTIALGMSSIVKAADKPHFILLTADEMKEVGIALRILNDKSGPFYQNSAEFPNRCYYNSRYELSISNEMLAQFTKRGFTLTTLCLAIEGFSRFDVEAGNPLPLAVPAVVRGTEKVAVWGNSGILLNIPDCYKGGIPILECKLKYEFHWAGKSEGISDHQKKEHAGMSTAARDGYAKECSCAEIEVTQYNRSELKLPGTCRVDMLPACVANKLPQHRAGVGSLVFEDRSSFRHAAGISSSIHGDYDINPSLPRSYGYMIAGPEGDDPQFELMDLSTAIKQTGTAAPWISQR